MNELFNNELVSLLKKRINFRLIFLEEIISIQILLLLLHLVLDRE